jgi:hypothetical protein
MLLVGVDADADEALLLCPPPPEESDAGGDLAGAVLAPAAGWLLDLPLPLLKAKHPIWQQERWQIKPEKRVACKFHQEKGKGRGGKNGEASRCTGEKSLKNGRASPNSTDR